MICWHLEFKWIAPGRRPSAIQQPSKHLENIRLSDELRGTKDELLRVTQELGLEGLVAKRRSSVYESGRGSGAWVKYKFTKSQEFVIGGYTLPEEGANISAPCSLVIRARRAFVCRQSRPWFSAQANLYAKFKNSGRPLVPL